MTTVLSPIPFYVIVMFIEYNYIIFHDVPIIIIMCLFQRIMIEHTAAPWCELQ